MFEIPKFTEEEFKAYMKVKLSLYMSSIMQRSEYRNMDLSQSEAEAMANDLWEYAPEDEFEYLDDNYGDNK